MGILQELLQQMVNGLALGSIYALIALGLDSNQSDLLVKEIQNQGFKVVHIANWF